MRSNLKIPALFTFVFMSNQPLFAADSIDSPESVFSVLTQEIKNLDGEQTLISNEHTSIKYYPNFLAQSTEETLRERVSTGANEYAWKLTRQATITCFCCFSGAGFLYGAYRAIYDNCVEQNCEFGIGNPLYSSLEAKAGGGGFGGIFGALLSVGGALGNAIYGIYIWHQGDKTHNSIPLANLIKASINIYESELSPENIKDLPTEDVTIIKDALGEYYIEDAQNYPYDKIHTLSGSAKFDNQRIMKIAERVYWAACGR